jgi:putative addiction module killer protein
MIEIVQSAAFESWFSGLKDVHARALITARIRRLSLGNAGDVKPVGAASARCASTMVPVTVCISCGAAK